LLPERKFHGALCEVENVGVVGGCCPGKIQRSWAVINSRAEEDTREGTAKVRDFVSASKGVR